MTGVVKVAKKRGVPAPEPEAKPESEKGISVRLVLDKETHHALRRLAADMNVSMSRCVRTLIDDAIRKGGKR